MTSAATVTVDDLKRAKPAPAQLINTKTLDILWYPAIKFPRRRRPVLVSWKRGEPAAAKSYEDAGRIAQRAIDGGLERMLRKRRQAGR